MHLNCKKRMVHKENTTTLSCHKSFRFYFLPLWVTVFLLTNEFIKLMQKLSKEGTYRETEKYGSFKYMKSLLIFSNIFQQLQDMDERRGCRLQGFIKQSAEIERAVIPIINTCIDGITQAASSINTSEVSSLCTYIWEHFSYTIKPNSNIISSRIHD